MNRTIATLAIAAVAVLGLTACSGGSDETAEDQTSSNDSATTQPETETETETSADQSVADACAIVIPALTEAGSSMSGLDMEAATTDPQATVDAFTETVDTIGEAADSVTNPEVKAAITTVYEQYGELRDILSAVLVDQDMDAASDMSTLSSDITTSATELGTLCTA